MVHHNNSEVVTTYDQASAFKSAFPNGVSPPSHCPNNGSFVTWLSGDNFVSAALCLRHQFTRVKSVCPLLLVYDDVGASLSSASHHRLARAFGAAQVIPISAIAANVSSSKASTSSTAEGRRRLYQNIQQTLPKLWIWALPAEHYPLLAYMDLDVLVHENIDDLFAMDFTTQAAAVACPVSAWYLGTSPRFNAGVMLIRPSLQVHERLKSLSFFTHYPYNGFVPRINKVVAPDNSTKSWHQICAPDVACQQPECLAASRLFPNATEPFRECRYAYGGHMAYRIETACSSKIGDQSIHNQVLRNKGKHGSDWNGWTAIGPMGINVDARRLTDLSGARLIHFLGEPKPWDPRALGSRIAAVAVRAYLEICRDQLPAGHAR